MRRVCIIGAGPAGLCAARHFYDYPEEFQVDHFEQTDQLGGLWVYSDNVQEHDEKGLPKYHLLYKNMRTNLPLNVMAYPDFPADGEKKFVQHERVIAYLQNYARHYYLQEKIQFHHQVKRLSRKPENQWELEVENKITGQVFIYHYDIVLVCAGRFVTPHIPQEFKDYEGNVVHSRFYRKADEYKDKTVMVIGAGQSGIDIMQEMQDIAKKVYFVHRRKQPIGDLPETVEEIISNVVKTKGDKIILQNKREISGIDTVFLGTGYEYQFDFIDETCGLLINPKGRIENLYLHFLNIKYPTMGLLGVLCRIIPFPIFDHQITLFIELLLNKTTLPSQEDMLKEAEEDLKKKIENGMHEKYAHHMLRPDSLWKYEERLCELGKMRPISEKTRQIYNKLLEVREKDPLRVKKMVVRVHQNGDVIFTFADPSKS